MTGKTPKSDLILDELKKRRVREKVVDVEEKTVKIVVFTVLNAYYAFYGEDVKEVLIPPEIFYVPGSPEHILGVINVRGDIESVLNINGLLGLPDSGCTQRTRIVIVEKNGVRSGIRIDSVEDVLDMPESAIKPPLCTLDKKAKEFVGGETAYNGRDVVLLNVGAVFGMFQA
ncbi:MAG: chemotaxis protein CheW [Nitrospirae bacterium]|nr:MAG: chemotaxis protein CheW [Nitrospirota bacterium]